MKHTLVREEVKTTYRDKPNPLYSLSPTTATSSAPFAGFASNEECDTFGEQEDCLKET